jgi:hypothetical protein
LLTRLRLSTHLDSFWPRLLVSSSSSSSSFSSSRRRRQPLQARPASASTSASTSASAVAGLDQEEVEEVKDGQEVRTMRRRSSAVTRESRRSVAGVAPAPLVACAVGGRSCFDQWTWDAVLLQRFEDSHSGHMTLNLKCLIEMREERKAHPLVAFRFAARAASPALHGLVARGCTVQVFMNTHWPRGNGDPGPIADSVTTCPFPGLLCTCRDAKEATLMQLKRKKGPVV